MGLTTSVAMQPKNIGASPSAPTGMVMQAVAVSIPGSSFSSNESGLSGSVVSGETSSSGCSSLAPYWIPEQVKHYFVHHHYKAAKKNSDSRIIDKALREIGLERELSTGDGSHWSKWSDPCPRLPRSTCHMFVAVTTAVMSVVLFAGVIIEYRTGMLSQFSVSPTVVSLKNEFIGTGGPPAIADKHEGHFLLPVPHDKSSIKEGSQEITNTAPLPGNPNDASVFPNEVPSQDPIATWKDGSVMGDEEMSVNTNLLRSKTFKKVTVRAWASMYEPLQTTTDACRTTPVFTLCSRGSLEFFYDHSRKACVAATANRLAVCNQGPNRFSSWESCRQRCVDSRATAAECHGKAVFAECQTRDVLRTWWYSDGKRCRRWPFPNGRCPAGRGNDIVFTTSAECVRRCWPRTRHRPCRTPKPVICNPKHLRFSYYADASGKGPPVRRCRQWSDAAETHYCLAGSNRFLSLSACRKTCLQGHAAYQTKL